MKNPSKYAQERQLLKHKPRKVLNLDERVLAIGLYQRIPVYQRIASMFKCSWEQIKNIVQNSDDILDYYKRCQVVEPDDGPQQVRFKKINFLGNTMYEFIKRAHYHRSATLSDDVLRKMALQFREVLQIEGFYPNRTWITDFKHVYNLDLDNLEQMIIPVPPPKTLDCKQIVSYCTRLVENTLACQRKNSATTKATKQSPVNECDDNTVRVVNASELIEESYFEDDDDMDDEEEINENEEGPTIDFGAYEYGEELGEPAIAQTTTTKSQLEEDETDAAGTSAAARGAQIRHWSEVQIKTERRSRSPSPVKCDDTTPRGNDEAICEKRGSQQEKRKANSVSSYAEALQHLQTLEDFALEEEDFAAMNLLTQLAMVYEQRAKRIKTS